MTSTPKDERTVTSSYLLRNDERELGRLDGQAAAIAESTRLLAAGPRADR